MGFKTDIIETHVREEFQVALNLRVCVAVYSDNIHMKLYCLGRSACKDETIKSRGYGGNF